jgi:hypothetical protein
MLIREVCGTPAFDSYVRAAVRSTTQNIDLLCSDFQPDESNVSRGATARYHSNGGGNFQPDDIDVGENVTVRYHSNDHGNFQATKTNVSKRVTSRYWSEKTITGQATLEDGPK